MNRARVSAITHGDRPFHNPFEPGRIDEVLRLLGLGPSERVLDIGCGPGELLVRAAEQFTCGGLGIDSEPIQIDEARRRAAARAQWVELRFEVADADEFDGGPYDLVTCIGSMHAVRGLDRLAELTRPGGHVLIGEGFWRRPPEPAYLDALGGAGEEELPMLDGLVAPRPGLETAYVSVVSDEEWDRYEWGLIFNGLRFAAEHPEDPDAADVAAWARRARDRYTGPGGRDTLGFALVLFRRA